MESGTYPFPLAVHSSHHSHYHRFMLGADPQVLSPFPKPYCVGALAAQLPALAEKLNLPRWRKLYHASIPWVGGFGPGHYELGNVPPHRPLPREYARPLRRNGAYDFVQVADPAVSALALVAGDRRIIERFAALGDEFCARVETGACSRAGGSRSPRATGRMLAGQFAEPNNRWLMPFLHVHARVLNFTSSAQEPLRLDCIDSASLGRAGQKAKAGWASRQVSMLAELGYRASLGERQALRVEGVCPRLVAAIEAPRIAVLRLLERALVGERPPSAARLEAELPPEVIAAMAEQLEALLARSIGSYRPAKIGIPAEGPWRGAVREHLSHHCPGALEMLDRAALRARATPLESAIFPTPPLDPAHCHAPCAESLGAAGQLPDDPELGACRPRIGAEAAAPAWLVREFGETLLEVNERNVRFGPDDPLVSLRGVLATIDHLTQGADPGQLRQSELLLGADPRARGAGEPGRPPQGRPSRRRRQGSLRHARRAPGRRRPAEAGLRAGDRGPQPVNAPCPPHLGWPDHQGLVALGADTWRIKDACEGTVIFGGTGSGKTSGSGRALARSFLAAGFGGLVLCAKLRRARAVAGLRRPRPAAAPTSPCSAPASGGASTSWTTSPRGRAPAPASRKTSSPCSWRSRPSARGTRGRAAATPSGIAR